jgi:hypothetical protein
MNRSHCTVAVTLGLWIAFAPTGAHAQEARRVHDSSGAPRSFLLPRLPQAALTTQQPLDGRTFARFAADGELNRGAPVQGAPSTRNGRSERSVARTVLGALVGAAGGFFAGGYLGATIEGDRCHCDDPGLKGALIGAPVGAVAGGILGSRYLF